MPSKRPVAWGPQNDHPEIIEIEISTINNIQSSSIIEGSLEVKLATYGQISSSGESSQRRKSQKKEDPGARKG